MASLALPLSPSLSPFLPPFLISPETAFPFPSALSPSLTHSLFQSSTQTQRMYNVPFPRHKCTSLFCPPHLYSKIEITSWINENRAPAKMHSILAQKLEGPGLKYMECPADIIIYCLSYCWCWIIRDYKMSSDRQAVQRRSVAD